jgi:glucose-1-phosphate thymidylyltransferase
MKALVLSGGSGTRLRPLSHSQPKQLLPVANRPILEYALDNLRALGVTEIGIVVGDGAAAIAETIGDGARWGARVSYLWQEQPLGLAHAVQVAEPFLGSDEFVLYLGDNVLPDGLGQLTAEFGRFRPAAQLAVRKVPDPANFGVAELDPDGRVRRLVEKPAAPVSDLALIGVYVFTPAIHAAVRSIVPSARGELEITDAVQWLLARGERVRAMEYRGFWRDAGQPEDLLECNRRLLSTVPPRVAGTVDAASRLDPQVVVEAGARVTRSRVEEATIIGAGTVVEDSHIGPYTSIGRDCLVRDTELADSIVLDRASIVGVSGLRRSLIGRQASIARGAGPAGGSRLLVGDHTGIELAG